MMRRMRAGGIALTLLLAALVGQVSSAGAPGPGDAGVPDGGRRAVHKRSAAPPPVVEPAHTSPADPCAEFNARPKLSAEEHQRLYGCPPCPCACVNGQITCAPCAACKGFRKDDALPEEPAPKPPPPRR